MSKKKKQKKQLKAAAGVLQPFVAAVDAFVVSAPVLAPFVKPFRQALNDSGIAKLITGAGA